MMTPPCSTKAASSAVMPSYQCQLSSYWFNPVSRMVFTEEGSPRFSSSGVMTLEGQPAAWVMNKASVTLPSWEAFNSPCSVGWAPALSGAYPARRSAWSFTYRMPTDGSGSAMA
ncbi:hypothetical protein D3C75_1204500 [compost metagenome]